MFLAAQILLLNIHRCPIGGGGARIG